MLLQTSEDPHCKPPVSLKSKLIVYKRIIGTNLETEKKTVTIQNMKKDLRVHSGLEKYYGQS